MGHMFTPTRNRATGRDPARHLQLPRLLPRPF